MSDKTREEFEEDFAKGYCVSNLKRQPDGQYKYDFAKWAFEGWQAAKELYAPREETVHRFRGQLQNCVNHLDRMKRKNPSYDATLSPCIESANKALYETLIATKEPQ